MTTTTERAQHTPGPWTTKKLMSVTAIEHGDGGRVCHLPHHMEHEGEPCGSIESQDKTQEEIDANAHLIAAAPGMLETLYRVRNFLACSGKALANSNCARVVDEQIAQAEGGAK